MVFGSRGSEVGHVFNVVNQGGVVRFLDGQTGRQGLLADETQGEGGHGIGQGRWTVNVPSRLPLTQCAEHPEGEASAGNPHGCWVSGESAPICTKSTISPGCRFPCPRSRKPAPANDAS
ncbi:MULTISPECIES: toxin glutamine deamidase domain-containing protein [unclassified Variovorax]|uniref:toxin glutamine deamidase domain-containing protein n=1 Tax=unclassified Variovorax TaxID=663243 RepID=UPI003F515293